MSWLSPLLIFIGVIFFADVSSRPAPGSWVASVSGLGLILLAPELIVQAVTPITQANGVQVTFRVADATPDARLARCSPLPKFAQPRRRCC
ncbi:hypothetical protein KCP76_11300 [Salmonella enterica subsp. enterica serovar Weltevreden]|nr:hypothetical protein KCP76_11300 [Salmonella enterica subsp. enterica serovar Weltevreden]